jgi:uncharacterized membrane protein (UPF0127 family)
MIGMRFSIDVLFLDRGGRVVHLHKGLEPGRISRWVRNSRTVVELPEGILEQSATCPGDTVVVRPPLEPAASL